MALHLADCKLRRLYTKVFIVAVETADVGGYNGGGRGGSSVWGIVNNFLSPMDL